MEQTSIKWYQSKTIGGIILAVVGAVVAYFGIQTGVDLPANPDLAQATQYVSEVKAAHGNVATIIGVAINAIGYVIALIGRVQAKVPIA
jgi:hypothetical protein